MSLQSASVLNTQFLCLRVEFLLSDFSKQMTEDRKQTQDKVLSLQVLPSVFCPLISVI
jgi:hypothetical protein